MAFFYEGMAVRTYVYIDGYNLYYGCLHRTKYKWLDIYKLFADHIVKAQSPDSSIDKVKLFTADIRANFATHGQLAHHAQNTYHRGLEHCYPDQIDIIKGYYSAELARLPRYNHPLEKINLVDVWKLEEKQTDVNLALHLYRDAVVQKCCERIIIVSNDTDIAPAVKLLRDEADKNVQIGIVIPMRKPLPNSRHRPPNEQLSKYAHWTRRYILDAELIASQLPDVIPTNKKPIRKPHIW